MDSPIFPADFFERSNWHITDFEEWQEIGKGK